MTRYEFVARQLERLRSFWPNLPVTEIALDEWVDLFAPYSEADINAGVRHIRDTYAEQGAPKPAHLIMALRHVRGDKPVTFSPSNPDEPLCNECGTKRTLWDDGLTDGRNGPSHLTTCSRHADPAGTTRDDLARFRAERAAQTPIPTRGLARIADVEAAPK